MLSCPAQVNIINLATAAGSRHSHREPMKPNQKLMKKAERIIQIHIHKPPWQLQNKTKHKKRK